MAADGWQSFTLFAPDHGHLHAMQRLAKKSAGTQALLDLFDEAALFLESSNQGRTWFVRETRLLQRPAGIGRSYAVLQEASAFARLIARNQVGPESRAHVAALLRTGLEAFGRSDRPHIVFFKCLYRFARDEGYPVKQEWFSALTAADRATVSQLINLPLDQQTAAAEAVAPLRGKLEDYLRQETEIRV